MSLSPLVLKSADSASTLTLSDIVGDRFTACYSSPEVTVSRRVWAYTDFGLLVDLFQSMARDWKGWDGERTWGSIEGEFSISATADRLGHVSLSLGFTQNDASEPWSVSVQLNLEAGQLERIARHVTALFGVSALDSGSHD
jgi:hypothetical protein